mmetsp:Transcript_12142/g.17806  ORF Transcript_12142/g.17806 Transcript_12142/m.17806 type:complete len:153 (+) Transcript_12142:138-596(+)
MKTFKLSMTLMLLSAVALFSLRIDAFHVFRTPLHQGTSFSTSSLPMSSEVDQGGQLGATERLLLDKARGIEQRLGKTVKKDGLDGVRAFVWSVYFGANYVFTGLGALLVLGLAMNMAGYGYYFDANGLNVDTLEHIRHDKFMAEEAARLMSK